MPAAFEALRAPARDAPLARATIASRPPAPGEVWIEVAGCGLSDPRLALEGPVPSRTPGGEIVGVVVEAGSDAAPLVGRRVLAPHLLPCGECDLCRRGRAAVCPRRVRPGLDVDGGLATHVLLPARYLIEVEDELAPPGVPLWQLAALSRAGALAHHGLSRLGVAPGEIVVVVGAAPLGALAVQLAVARGATAIAVDVDPARLERARALGAQAALDAGALGPDALDAAVAEAERTLGAAARLRRIVETTGEVEGIVRAFALARPGSAVALLGPVDPAACAAPLARLVEAEATVVGVPGAHPDLLVELLALVVRGELRLEPLVEAIPLARVEAALAAVRDGRAPRLSVAVPR